MEIRDIQSTTNHVVLVNNVISLLFIMPQDKKTCQKKKSVDWRSIERVVLQ